MSSSNQDWMKDDGECRMTDHPNLYNWALTILRNKGFKLLIWPDPEDKDSSNDHYYAKKGDRDFNAEDPLRLLGMISIWENYGDEWYHEPLIPVENVWKVLEARAMPESLEEMEGYSEEDFQAYVSEYREFFSLDLFPNIELPADISRQAFYEIVTTYYKMEFDEED